MQRVFGDLIASELPLDNAPCFVARSQERFINYQRDTIIQFISGQEINKLHHRMKNSAPGPNGISVSDLQKCRSVLLAVLYTSILCCGNIPTMWKRNRMVLIPKGKNNRSVATNWRPLTISPVFVRLLH